MVEGIPGRGRTSQPTVLVSGPSLKLLRWVPLQLFRDRAAAGDGAVIATARGDPAFVSRQLSENVPAFDPERIALVNCCDGRCESSPAHLWDVESAVSFVDVEASVESARRALEDRNARRRHFLFDTLSTQFRFASDPEQVLQHADDLAMSLGAEEGLTVFAVDSATVTDREHERLRHLFDVHVEVRCDDDPELRWTGLIDRSDGWVPFADAGSRFDACGKSTG